jgi:hypothetical protein
MSPPKEDRLLDLRHEIAKINILNRNYQRLRSHTRLAVDENEKRRRRLVEIMQEIAAMSRPQGLYLIPKSPDRAA